MLRRSRRTESGEHRAGICSEGGYKVPSKRKTWSIGEPQKNAKREIHPRESLDEGVYQGDQKGEGWRDAQVNGAENWETREADHPAGRIRDHT